MKRVWTPPASSPAKGCFYQPRQYRRQSPRRHQKRNRCRSRWRWTWQRRPERPRFPRGAAPHEPANRGVPGVALPREPVGSVLARAGAESVRPGRLVRPAKDGHLRRRSRAVGEAERDRPDVRAGRLHQVRRGRSDRVGVHRDRHKPHDLRGHARARVGDAQGARVDGDRRPAEHQRRRV